MLTLQDLLRTRTTQPPLNKAMYFSGTSSYIEGSFSLSWSATPELNNYTFCMYVYPRKTPMSGWSSHIGRRDIYFFGVGFYNSSKSQYTGIALEFIDTNGDDVPEEVHPLGFYMNVDEWDTPSPINIGLEQWTFLCGVFNSWTNAVGYNVLINGTKTTSVVRGWGGIHTWSGYADKYRVAPQMYGSGAGVYVASVLIYRKRALTLQEVAYIAQNSNNPIRDGLVLWLDARACDTSKNICYDLSGNNNHGTMYNVQIVSLSNPVRAGGSL